MLKTKLRACETAKTAAFKLLESSKLISHKISVAEKSPNFHNVTWCLIDFIVLSELINQTVTTGGSNSVLLLGPRGVGKTHLVDLVLQKAKNESQVFKKDGLIVKLHGLVETDDKLALKQIARQLKLENVEGDRVFGSFAEHLEFLLSSLRSGDRHSKPVVFVLEEFHLFCSHHNQTLLYNLFDVAQSKGNFTSCGNRGILPSLKKNP